MHLMIFKTYRIDPKHSQLHLEMEHLGGISVLTALMTGFSGRLKADAGQAPGEQLLSFDALIDAKSVSSSLVTFDPFLKSAEMFDVKSFPVVGLSVLSFLSSSGIVKGKLTLREVEKECELKLWSARSAVNRRGFNIVGIRGAIEVSCSSFGMTGTPTLDDTARLVVNIEATDEPVTGAESCGN